MLSDEKHERENNMSSEWWSLAFGIRSGSRGLRNVDLKRGADDRTQHVLPMYALVDRCLNHNRPHLATFQIGGGYSVLREHQQGAFGEYFPGSGVCGNARLVETSWSVGGLTFVPPPTK